MHRSLKSEVAPKMRQNRMPPTRVALDQKKALYAKIAELLAEEPGIRRKMY